MEASNLPEAQASASQASAALKGVERGSLHSLCSWTSVRALLMQGRDEEACRVAASEPEGSPKVRWLRAGLWNGRALVGGSDGAAHLRSDPRIS